MPKKPSPWVEPVVLEGNVVKLEPIKPKHARHLAAVYEREVLQYFVTPPPADQSVAAMKEFIGRTRDMANTVGFAIVHRDSRRPIGMTSFMDIREEHSALEIGMTWIARAWQGTTVNPEAKLLMMEHAFERLFAERVQLKTDGRNVQSQRAIEKLGATKEGVLRRHSRMPDGYMRDTVMYSILRTEWPAVKLRLMESLSRPIAGKGR